ncbi:DUF58 domain-containing protein [Halioxenophilus sp. WMMB6]|uniref:DUF58 domain-containing protein n=1 Tax=Halioxenophilus sp. WMMB6 TaxID=3073815 RepID=UPI00295EFCA3|nr:DUF58 domain-containing protein [Halioxenophilus sp. WMMB6]
MWKLLAKPRRWVERRFQRFLERAIPRRQSVKLGQKQLFILPTANGWGYMFAASLIWLLGTNYENNLALALAYFLAALFLVAIVHTFNNLFRLEIKYLQAKPVFAGEMSEVQLQFTPGGVNRFAIDAYWSEGNRIRLQLPRDEPQLITLYVPAKQRGWYRPPRVTLETTFPVGLWRCWSHIDLDVLILTYPKPITCKPLPHSASDHQQGQLQPVSGGEDFYSLRSYQAGDSLKHVAWKHYAQGRGLHTKNYSAHLDTRIWLDWSLLPGLDREARLSRLAYLALEAEKLRDEYGLKLPGLELPPNRGKNHLQSILKALALFEPPTTSVAGGGQP